MHRRKFLGGAGIAFSPVTAGLAVNTTRNHQAANESRDADTVADGIAWRDSSSENGDDDETKPEHNPLSAGGSLRITNDSGSSKDLGVTVHTGDQEKPLFQYNSTVKPDNKIVATGIVSEPGQYFLEVETADTEEWKTWEVTGDTDRRNVRIGFNEEGKLALWVMQLH